MSYVTVYEITHEPFPWWIAVHFLVLSLIGAVILLDTRRLGFVTKGVRYFMLLFACAVVILYSLHFLNHRRYVQAYQNGKYAVAEGPVDQYSWRGKSECFSVRGVRFCRGTADWPGLWPDGLLREGLPVRIVYADNQFPVILRLDIGRSSR